MFPSLAYCPRGSDVDYGPGGLAFGGCRRTSEVCNEALALLALKLWLPLRDSDFSWGSRAVSLGAAAAVSGEEMQARALRSELGSVSGLSLVGRTGGGGGQGFPRKPGA